MAEGTIRDAIRRLIGRLDEPGTDPAPTAADPGADDVYMGPDPRGPQQTPGPGEPAKQQPAPAASEETR